MGFIIFTMPGPGRIKEFLFRLRYVTVNYTGARFVAPILPGKEPDTAGSAQAPARSDFRSLRPVMDPGKPPLGSTNSARYPEPRGRPRISAVTCGYYRTSRPVAARPMIMRWILEVRAVSAGRWPDS
jgi:hypothetical protein